MRWSRRDERAVTVVEAAFALPILFLFVLALVDLGTWTLESNKAANAARDGARAAMIRHAGADAGSGSDRTAVVDAIQAHLPGRTLAPGDITIECIDPDGNAVVGGCAAATIDQDRIRVTTRWDKRFISPIAGILGASEAEVQGAATMVIVGRPVAPPAPVTTVTTPPSGCLALGLTATPFTNTAKTGGGLEHNVQVNFIVAGTSSCAGLVVQVVAPGGGTVNHACGCSGGLLRSWTYGKSTNNFWTAGQATVRVLDGASTLASTTFTVN